MEREFKEVIKTLKEAKRLKYIRDFALTGALALSALTQPRATRDIDILISIEKDKIKNFVEWLSVNKGYRLTKHHRGRRKDRIKDLIEIPLGSTHVDLIAASSDIETEAVNMAVTVRTYSMTIRVVGPEHLIILKLLAGSDQDYIDAAHLWNEDIDRSLVEDKAGDLFMERKLKKMKTIAKRLP